YYFPLGGFAASRNSPMIQRIDSEASSMSDRKYRQRGYMDHGEQREQRPKPGAKPQEREGLRSPRMMAFGQKVKCAACGATIQTTVNVDAECSKCKASLHN